MTSRGVQTQLTEEQVRDMLGEMRRNQNAALLNAGAINLASDWLRLKRIEEAARGISGLAIGAWPELKAALDEYDGAAVSVGSPETRETEE